MRVQRQAFLTVALMFLGVSSSHGVDRTSELLTFLPAGANAVGVVRVEEILKSPRAVAEHWADQQTADFLAGAATVPRWVNTLVIASLVHPEVPEEVWTAAVLPLPADIDLAEIAAREGSPITDLDGHRAVRSPRDTWFVELKPGILGMMRPGFRQQVARWMRDREAAREPALSPYLNSAAARAGHVILAIDTDEMLSQPALQAYLSQTEKFATRPAEAELLSRLLGGLRGVTLTVLVTKSVRAELSIDLAAPPGQLGSEISQVLFDSLQAHGLRLEDFDASEIFTQGNSVKLVTALSDSGWRHLMSLIVSPLPTRSRGREGNLADIDDSRQYLKAVNSSLDDLDRASRRGTSLASIATWHDNYARKIDNLPTANVDQELVDYAARVASQLRALAASLRGVAVEVNVQERTITYNSQFDPGWSTVNGWGGYGYRPPSVNLTSNLKEVRERQAAAIAAGAQKREQIWGLITDERSAIKRRMDEKFGRNF